MAKDITERKTIEEELELARFVLEHAPDAIFITGADGRFLKVNQAACNSLGYTREEFLSLSILDVSPLVKTPEAWQDLLARLRNSGSLRVVTPQMRKDGSNLPMELFVNHLSFGGKDYVCTTARDVSAWQQAEQTLQESEERYRVLFEYSPIGIGIEGFDGRMLSCNPAMSALTGYGLSDLSHAAIIDTFSDPATYVRMMTTIRESGKIRDQQVELERKDGSTCFALVNMDVVEIMGRKVVLANFQDVSDARRLELELAHLRESLELLVTQRTAELVAANHQLAMLNKELLCEVKERLHAELDLKTSRDQLVSLTSEINLVEEHERRRIATALHDGVVQNLALGKLKLSMMPQGEMASSPTEQSALALLLGEAIENIRDICFDLSPPPLYDLGLPQAIESLGERLARDHGFIFSMQDMLTPMDLPMAVRTILYQIARELLVNVVKHADAQHVSVLLRHKIGMLQLTVVDDGVGFGPDVTKGFGLSNLAQRTEYLNGSMRIISKPGRKTVIAVVVPINFV